MSSAMEDDSVSTMWKLLETTPADMNAKFPHLATIEVVAKAVSQTGSTSKYQQYFDLLNHTSYAIHDVVNKDADPIHFFNCHDVDMVLEGHPAKTVKRPDFLAQKVPPGEKPSVFYWSALEVTGEFLSGNKKKRAAVYETSSYTSYLLQARPDRLAVQGMCIQSEGFQLIISNACGAFHTEFLEWESQPFRLLLAAWIWRLYHPVVDPSITTNIELNKAPTFSIHCPDETFEDCEILSVGSGFIRRTIVFKAANANTIIKEQYIKTSRKSEETDNLSKVHSKGSFPGVVRLGWYGPVTSNQQELIVKWENLDKNTIYERKKMRMVMLDKGGSLMNAETLRDALIAMYDLLEVTRFLHTHRKIFHRDISINNVLLRKAFPAADAKHPLPATDLQGMCFASYLLNEKSAGSSVHRLDTRVLLIDFDISEDQEGRDRGGRAGTPGFMARAVRSSRQRGSHFLFSMPQLSAGRDAYERTVGDRLIAFPPNESELDHSKDGKLIEPFTHRLRYDAESVFWLLLWWALHAQPEADDQPEESLISSSILGVFTSDTEMRESFIPNFWGHFFHPFYKPLEPFFKLMAQQLSGYPEESRDPSRKKDEYLHEALQRSILDFLFNNYDESFMKMKISPKSRRPRPVISPKDFFRLYGRWRRPSTTSSDGSIDSGEDVGHENKRRRR